MYKTKEEMQNMSVEEIFAYLADLVDHDEAAQNGDDSFSEWFEELFDLLLEKGMDHDDWNRFWYNRYKTEEELMKMSVEEIAAYTEELIRKAPIARENGLPYIEWFEAVLFEVLERRNILDEYEKLIQ